jgi:hypothetical protein
MNKLSTTVAIFAASLLAIPAAHAFQWEDSIFPETEEERREEARERASDAREEAEEEAAKRRGEHPVVN